MALASGRRARFRMKNVFFLISICVVLIAIGKFGKYERPFFGRIVDTLTLGSWVTLLSLR